MIPMSCPSCGRRGNVPLDRLNTRMHCKKCDAVFHLDATGKPVLGEPKPAKGSKTAAKGRAKDEPLDPIGIVAGKLAQVPRNVYFSLLGVMGLGLLYMIYANSGPGPLPRDVALIRKADDVARAFIAKDADALRKMATDDTKDDAAKLIDEFRGELQDSGVPADQIFVVVGPASDGSGQPKITIDFQLPTPEGGKTPPATHLDTLWYENKDTWYLNGKDSLAENKGRVIREKQEAALKKK